MSQRCRRSVIHTTGDFAHGRELSIKQRVARAEKNRREEKRTGLRRFLKRSAPEEFQRFRFPSLRSYYEKISFAWNVYLGSN